MISTVPNLLSLSRMIMAVWLFSAILSGKMILGAWLIIVSAITDFLDGYIARRFNQRSAVGELLDPLADKLFLIALFSGLVIKQLLPFWIFIIFVVRDTVLLLGSAFIKWKEIPYKFTPTFISKVNTNLQFLFGFVALVYPNSPLEFVLIGMLLVTTILSWITYSVRFFDRVFE